MLMKSNIGYHWEVQHMKPYVTWLTVVFNAGEVKHRLSMGSTAYEDLCYIVDVGV